MSEDQQKRPVEASIHGICCPVCGCSDLRVIRTEQRQNRVSRRRECRHCGKRITTTERVVGK